VGLMVATALPAPNGAGSSKISTRPVPGRPFEKGQSGNPLGRPRGQAGFAAWLRDQTKDGKEVGAFVLSVLRNKKVDIRTRLEAATWIANRAFGTPIQAHEVTGAEGGEIVFTLRIGERDAGDG
jgi:hypothetical protein